MTVFDRRTQDPVEGAGVWALTRDEASALQEQITSATEASEDSDAEMDYESLVSVYGIFLGRTNERGQLQHAFDEAGRYILVTVKAGYFPGFGIIGIHSPDTRTPDTTDSPDIMETPVTPDPQQLSLR